MTKTLPPFHSYYNLVFLFTHLRYFFLSPSPYLLLSLTHLSFSLSPSLPPFSFSLLFSLSPHSPSLSLSLASFLPHFLLPVFPPSLFHLFSFSSFIFLYTCILFSHFFCFPFLISCCLCVSRGSVI